MLVAAGSSQSKVGFAGRVNISVIEKVRQVFQNVLCAQGLTFFFLTMSNDLIKDITFPYKSCLLYTFRASHFQRLYYSNSTDKAAIKGYDERFFMSFFVVLFSWCSRLTSSLVSLDVRDVLVWSLACSASKCEVPLVGEPWVQPLPALPGLFCKRAPLNLPAAAQSSTSLSSKTSKCSRPRLYYVVGFFFLSPSE